jgi:hypothetical protein
MLVLIAVPGIRLVAQEPKAIAVHPMMGMLAPLQLGQRAWMSNPTQAARVESESGTVRVSQIFESDSATVDVVLFRAKDMNSSARFKKRWLDLSHENVESGYLKAVTTDKKQTQSMMCEWKQVKGMVKRIHLTLFHEDIYIEVTLESKTAKSDPEGATLKEAELTINSIAAGVRSRYEDLMTFSEGGQRK